VYRAHTTRRVTSYWGALVRGSEIQVSVGASTSSSWINCAHTTRRVTSYWCAIVRGSEIQVSVGASTSSSWITCVQSTHNTTCNFLLGCSSEGFRDTGQCRSQDLFQLDHLCTHNTTCDFLLVCSSEGFREAKERSRGLIYKTSYHYLMIMPNLRQTSNLTNILEKRKAFLWSTASSVFSNAALFPQ